LLGQPIDKLIPPIPSGECLEAVRRSLEGSPGESPTTPHSACRPTRSSRRALLQREGAAWARRELPRWADLIDRALGWRQCQHDPDGQADGAATVAETRSIVAAMARLAAR
jgi:hypothetical protein